jgi:pimeloyl-ACP methyl ester carboxylesterase
MHPTLVCLHGWGGSSESFKDLRAALSDSGIRILSPDLPGFGKEPDPKRPWTVDDYADWVSRYIVEHVDGPFWLLGHSNGGRIAIKLAVRDELPIEHLFLCASAGIKHARHFKRIVGLTLSKTGKLLLSVPGLHYLEPMGKRLLYGLIRVHDYERANPIMRDTLIRITKEDLAPILHKITQPTDIFWGEGDRMTPYPDALQMHKSIKGSVLHSYPDARHGVHQSKAAEIAAVIQGRITA